MARDRACVCLCAECIGKSICWGNKYFRTENALKCQKKQLQFLYVSYVGEPKTHWQRESVFVWSIDASKQKKREKECWLWESEQPTATKYASTAQPACICVGNCADHRKHAIPRSVIFLQPVWFLFHCWHEGDFWKKKKNNEWKVKYCLVSTYCWWCIWLH